MPLVAVRVRVCVIRARCPPPSLCPLDPTVFHGPLTSFLFRGDSHVIPDVLGRVTECIPQDGPIQGLIWSPYVCVCV